jgi:phosphoenolpyruvate---glycerone phosphotransferase subunit DhaL
MSAEITADQVRAAMRAVAAALAAQAAELTELDQAVGDGDLGITASKIAETLAAYAEAAPEPDLGKLIGQAGIAVNRAAPSTMGTLTATALMRAGQAVRGKQAITLDDLAKMLTAADAGIQERGKARPGDKTLIDAVHPATDALILAAAEQATLAEAGSRVAAAARAGRDSVTPLRNNVGRASWLGERSAGKIDPGATFAVIVLEALAGG